MGKDMTIYITRHGVTQANKGFYNGKLLDGTPIVQTCSDGLDNQLDEDGVAEGKLKGLILQNSGVEVSYHSGLGRTEETTKYAIKNINPAPLIIEDTRFRDKSFGHWEGMTLSELGRCHEGDFKRWQEAEDSGDFNFKLKGVYPSISLRGGYTKNIPFESENDVIRRISPALEDVVKRDKTSLIVTHGHLTKALLWKLSQESDFCLAKEQFGKILTPNEAIYKITLGKARTIEHFNYEASKWTEGFLQ